MQEDLKAAKADVKIAGRTGIAEQLAAARARAKAIKVELKEFEKEIAERSKPMVDQAKIDELTAKIAEAEARQEQAFDDDDDEAEEAAAADVIKYSKQLEELTAGVSIPKQKLEDAKKKDGEINK